jgi:predicted ferric reductase
LSLQAAGPALGIAALALWCASFVLMLRLPSFERAAGGLDRLYWLHHVCGTLAYLVMLAHPLALAAQAFAAGDWPAAAAIATPPGQGAAMRAGWVALALLMAMMVATFWLPLGYSRWRAIHVVTAPAFAFGVGHAWSFAGPGTRVALAAMTAIALAALAWRYALGRGWVLAHPYRVARVAHPGPGLLDLDLESAGAPLRWRPGQFVFVAFHDGPGWRGCGEYHPYTIAGPAPRGGMRMLIRSLGDCTDHLQTVRVGVEATVQGPYGAFLERCDPRRAQLWVAGGIGITPFLAALADHAGTLAQPIDLVHVYRPGDLPAPACLPQPPRPLPDGARLHAIESAGDAEVLWSTLARRVGTLAGRQAFLCGPPSLVDALRRRLVAAGVPPRDIHSERFDFR